MQGPAAFRHPLLEQFRSLLAGLATLELLIHNGCAAPSNKRSSTRDAMIALELKVFIPGCPQNDPGLTFPEQATLSSMKCHQSNDFSKHDEGTKP